MARESASEREREREERSIIFDFTVYVDVVYLGSSRVLFSHNTEHIPFVRSFARPPARSLSLVYAGILFCFMLSSPLGQSAMRKEKE